MIVYEHIFVFIYDACVLFFFLLCLSEYSVSVCDPLEYLRSLAGGVSAARRSLQSAFAHSGGLRREAVEEFLRGFREWMEPTGDSDPLPGASGRRLDVLTAALPAGFAVKSFFWSSPLLHSSAHCVEFAGAAEMLQGPPPVTESLCCACCSPVMHSKKGSRKQSWGCFPSWPLKRRSSLRTRKSHSHVC